MKTKKVIKLVEELKRFPVNLESDDIRYILQIADLNPRWSAKRILNEALKPKIRSGLIIYLTPKLREALMNFASEYKISMRNAAYNIIEEYFGKDL